MTSGKQLTEVVRHSILELNSKDVPPTSIAFEMDLHITTVTKVIRDYAKQCWLRERPGILTRLKYWP